MRITFSYLGLIDRLCGSVAQCPWHFYVARGNTGITEYMFDAGGHGGNFRLGGRPAGSYLPQGVMVAGIVQLPQLPTSVASDCYTTRILNTKQEGVRQVGQAVTGSICRISCANQRR